MTALEFVYLSITWKSYRRKQRVLGLTGRGFFLPALAVNDFLRSEEYGSADQSPGSLVHKA